MCMLFYSIRIDANVYNSFHKLLVVCYNANDSVKLLCVDVVFVVCIIMPIINNNILVCYFIITRSYVP